MLMAFFSRPALANLPESGWYWNPAASGSGYNIELQDDKMFMSAFTYDSQGRAVFYTAGGVFNVNTSTLNSVLYVTSGGQCMGCPYVAPVSTALAPVEIYFPTTRTARIRAFFSVGTAEINLGRFNFGYALSPAHEHLGVWSILEGGSGIYFGEALNMRTTCTLTNLIDSFCGERFGSASRVAVGARVAAGSSLFMVLLDSSSSYYSRYIYVNDTNRWIGLAATYLKTATPPSSTSGLDFIGLRISGPSTSNQFGWALPDVPTDPKRSAGEEQMRQRAEALAGKSGAHGGLVPPEVARALESVPQEALDQVTAELVRALDSAK
ncbi:MAG: hypothetical protein IPH76_05600 [Xanthomonadales bacterium]|nr:hypothetical protein [Xanthomonadales bacterium]